jgi:hypothetical protein
MVARSQLTPELLKTLSRLSAEGSSRTGLSKYLCETLNWRGPSGHLQLLQARKLLRQLEKSQQLQLQPPGRTFPKAKAVPPYIGPAIQVEKLAEVGPVELILVPPGGSPEGALWKSLLAHHPLGSGPLCGAQLRYLIKSSAGWLGGLAFSAAARHIRVRDQWIGWSPRARIHHRHEVLNNSRFMILPNVKVPNLASHVLSLASRRLPEDWIKRYGYRPLLLESFVDHTEHTGHSYRVANWDYLGQTSGRGRQDRERQNQVTPKAVWVYALQRDARKRLRKEPPKPTSHQPGQNWTEQECGRARLPGRLKKRLQIMLGDFFARPTANLPQACGSWAKTKAAYRFFDNPKVRKEFILESHFEETAARVAEQGIVLAVQDTTFLDYSTHPQTKDLGHIGSKSSEQSQGLVVHGTMAFTPTGLPLGLIDLQSWARDDENFGKRHRRKELPIEEKESFKWIESFRQARALQERCPSTRLISVGDRESDVYELFLEAKRPGAPELVIRAERDRALTQEEGLLWEKMDQEPVQACYTLEVTAGKNRTARLAHLEVRFAPVTLKPPQRLKGQPPVQLWAVYALESGTQPNEKERLEWMLLTTLEVKSVTDALRVIDYYKQRWGIERFHKVLKSGCRIEDRQLGDARSLEACLAIDAMVAWRIYFACQLAREVPEAPCTIFFEEAEWKALTAFRKGCPQPASQPPTLKEMVDYVAELGGYLGRKGDGPPGTQTLWRGFQRLDDITEAWNAFGPEAEPPVPSYHDSG